MSWTRRSRTRTPDALTIGRRSDGEPLRLPLGWHTLIGGLSGAGKSTTIRALLASAAPLPDLAIVLVDVKRVESAPWRARTAQRAVTTREALHLLTGLLTEVDHRGELLEQAGLVDWDTRHGPRILLVIDELAGVIATGEPTDRQIVSVLRQLLERGRFTGLTIVLATQRPASDVIPTAIRDLCALRIAHATANPDSTRMILAAAAELGPAHQIPVDDLHRGRCWVSIDGDREPIEARCAYVDPDSAAQLARRTAHLNVDWRTVPVDARPPATDLLAGAISDACTAAGPDITPDPPHAPYAASLPHPALLGAPGLPDVTVYTADDTLWLHHLDHELGSRAPTWRTSQGQPNEVRAAARREAPSAPPATVGPDTSPGLDDEAVVLAVLRTVPDGLCAGDIPARAGIPEGRTRRARQALAERRQITLVGTRWVALA